MAGVLGRSFWDHCALVFVNGIWILFFAMNGMECEESGPVQRASPVVAGCHDRRLQPVQTGRVCSGAVAVAEDRRRPRCGIATATCRGMPGPCRTRCREWQSRQSNMYGPLSATISSPLSLSRLSFLFSPRSLSSLRSFAFFRPDALWLRPRAGLSSSTFFFLCFAQAAPVVTYPL